MARFTIDTDNVVGHLQGKSLKGKKRMRLDVGYEAPYAVYVHEDLTANHPNGGQAKFLETAIRRTRKQVAEIIATSLKNKDGLETALLRAGRHVLATSRPLVPVDTGFLRDSGYVKVV